MRINMRMETGTVLIVEKVKVIFYLMYPNFGKTIVFWKVLRLCWFVLLVRATCR
jgi:hypothetical protein